ncbi:MAG: hypothetical protein ABW169_16110 [Sphingobium sp.]
MPKFLWFPACLLLASCQSQTSSGEADSATARAMRDDVGGRLFYIESRDRHDGKRSTLILSCHGDGDNIVMFKTQVALTAPPAPDAVFFDYSAGATKGRAEAKWNNADIWIFRDSAFSQKFAKLFLTAPEVTIRFPDQTGAPHTAKWSRSTAVDLENQLIGWCLKPASGS